ncbi:MAG: aldo/keto reductase [Verrucomicrobiota bacterium JB022]|nr:aldo/keto reductase [Verrucomicrobiota bacterium JB022]
MSGEIDFQGKSVSRLALGCMHFGGDWAPGTDISEDARRQARAALVAAQEAGINFFDHADIYCRGRSERLFGELARELGLKRRDYVLQSKVGIRFADEPEAGAPKRFDFSYAHIMRTVNASLERLQTDYLDCLLLHRPDLLMEIDEVAQAFRELHAQGRVRHFGVSNHTPWQIMRLQAALDQPLVVNQIELSLIKSSLLDCAVVSGADRQPMVGTVADGTLDFHQLHKIRTQAWAPLAYGYLSGRRVGDEFKQGSEVKARIEATSALVSELAQKYRVAPEAIVVGWLLRLPAGVQPVVGTRDPARIKACAAAQKIELGREDWYRLFLAGRGQELP